MPHLHPHSPLCIGTHRYVAAIESRSGEELCIVEVALAYLEGMEGE